MAPREGRAQNGTGELLPHRRVPGMTSDEAPKHSLYSSPNGLGCGVDAPRNGAGLDAVARNK